MVKWEKGTFKIQAYMNRGEIDQPGYVSEFFGIFKAGKSYAVTHLVSGLGIHLLNAPTLAEAKSNVERVSHLNWNFKEVREIAAANNLEPSELIDLCRKPA